MLAVPASGAGVKRLFNAARDICHFRRGQIKEETIREQILYQCATKFEIKYSEHDQLREYISDGEAALLEQITDYDSFQEI
jgi:hypothetical protein